MPCFHPLEAWKTRDGAIVFSPGGAVGFSLQLPCGQCIGCRLERSRQWAMRCMHEASLFDDNCFITLTYSDEFLPSDGSLDKKHFQDFMKRLRSSFSERRIRYYHCGEYGSKFRRPHYHALLFNFDFVDKKLFSTSKGQRLYTSEVLEKLWRFGFGTVGAVTFESAAYTARYIMKKVTGDRAEEHYVGCDEVTGTPVQLLPEYTTMSRRPGIGRAWYERFSNDVFPLDEVVLRGGRSMRPPRFYDCIYELQNPEDFARIKSERLSFSRKDCTPERLRVREFCKIAEVSRLGERGFYET